MVFPFLIQLAIGIVLNVLAYLILPKPKGPKPPAVSDLETPTADAARPIPVVFGTILHSGAERDRVGGQGVAEEEGEAMTPARVTARDCARAGFCVSGMKDWLAERGVDYRAFVRDGLPGAEVEAFGDAMSDLALAQARKRERETV